MDRILTKRLENQIASLTNEQLGVEAPLYHNINQQPATKRKRVEIKDTSQLQKGIPSGKKSKVTLNLNQSVPINNFNSFSLPRPENSVNEEWEENDNNNRYKKTKKKTSPYFNKQKSTTANKAEWKNRNEKGDEIDSRKDIQFFTKWKNKEKGKTQEERKEYGDKNEIPQKNIQRPEIQRKSKYFSKKTTENTETPSFKKIGFPIHRAVSIVPSIQQRNQALGGIPREDGKMTDDKDEEPYGTTWKDEIITRESLLENHPDYRFIREVAGNTDSSKVINMYESEGLEAIWKSRMDFSRQQKILQKRDEDELIRTRDEITKLSERYNLLYESIKDGSNLRNVYKMKMGSFIKKGTEIKDRIKDEESYIRTLFLVPPIYMTLNSVDLSELAERPKSAVIERIKENIKVIYKKNGEWNPNFRPYFKRFSAINIEKLVEDGLIGTYIDKILKFQEWVTTIEGEGTLDQEQQSVLWIIECVILLYYYLMSLRENNNNRNINEVKQKIGSIKFSLLYNDKGLEFTRQSPVYITVMEMFDDLKKEFTEDAMTNVIRHTIESTETKLDTFVRKLKKLQEKVVSAAQTIDVNIYSGSDPIQYFEEQIQLQESQISIILKESLETQDRINQLNEKLREYENLKTANLPYSHSRRWVMSPEMSGYIRLKPSVVSAITRAYNDVIQYIPSLAKATAEELQHSDMTMGPFARLVAAEIGITREQFPNTWMPDRKSLDVKLAKANAIRDLRKIDHVSGTIFRRKRLL